MDVFHVAIDAQFEAHDEFVADAYRAFDRLQRRAPGGVDLGVERFFELERSAFVGRDLAHVFEVLPMDASPGDTRVHFSDDDFAQLGFDIGGGEAFLEEARAGFDGASDFRFPISDSGARWCDVDSAQGNLDERVAGQDVASAQEEGVNGVRRGFGGLPVLGLFLLEEPDPAFFDRLGVFHDFVEGFDHEGLGLDGGAIPPPVQLRLAPEHAQLFIGHAAFPDRFHDVAGSGIVEGAGGVEAVQRQGKMALRLAVRHLEPMGA